MTMTNSRHSSLHSLRSTASVGKATSRDDPTRVPVHIMYRHSVLAEKELQSVEQDKARFLDMAVSNYGKALAAAGAGGGNSGGGDDDIAVFRYFFSGEGGGRHLFVFLDSAPVRTKSNFLKYFFPFSRFVSLWFSNSEDSSVCASAASVLDRAPEHRFVPLARQLSARLSCSSSSVTDFSSSLSSLLVRCAERHPFHVVPVLLALANANKDEEMSEGTKSKGGAKSSSSPSLDDRGRAALAILKRVKATSERLG